MSEIPVGICHCGCGERTRIVKNTDAARGLIAGQPRRYINGHQWRGRITATPEDRFWVKVKKTDTCWLWTAHLTNGYGRHYVAPGVVEQAHRFAYELLVGPIPNGLHLDHLCRNTACVRPDHLEPVTQQENTRRGLKGRLVTHCAQGHEYTAENTYTKRNGCRQCRACGAASASARRRNRSLKEEATA